MFSENLYVLKYNNTYLLNFLNFTIMKKILFCLFAVVLATSCTTIKKTATTMDVNTSISAQTTADLVVSDNKISYTLYPTQAIRKGGVNNIINVAVAEALEANDADVLVAPEYTIVSKRNFFFRTKVKEITVTGYPAKYRNFEVK